MILGQDGYAPESGSIAPVSFIICARILPDSGYADCFESHPVRGRARNLDRAECPCRSNPHLVDQRGSHGASGLGRQRLRRSTQRFDRRSSQARARCIHLAILASIEKPVTTSQKNSPAPEVPRFECNGPHPPPRSLQTDRKAAPAHRILDRGNKTTQAAAALAVSSQPANSRRLAYNK